MFVEFLSLIAGGTMVMTLFMEGRQLGLTGNLIALLAGTLIGVIAFWATRKGFEWAIFRWHLHEAHLSPARLALVWSLLAVWFLLVTLASIFLRWAMKLALHKW